MIDLNTDSWARVAADKSKNTRKTELGARSGSVSLNGLSSSSSLALLREWRDVKVGWRRGSDVGPRRREEEPAGCSIWQRGVNAGD